MDARYLGTVWNALTCQTAGSFNGQSFVLGDTVVYYPDVAWTPAQKALVKYAVVNPDEYRNKLPSVNLEKSFPEFKKFRELGITFNDNLGTRDTYVFRLAETYLIASEAYLQLNNTTKALQYYNVVRARAAKSGYSTLMQVASVTLDDILDERARELAGEEFRWFELKRTGKLFSRTLLHNEECAAKNTALDAHFLLRPIPNKEIIWSDKTLTQNDGY
jgi:hypothetical protein